MPALVLRLERYGQGSSGMHVLIIFQIAAFLIFDFAVSY
jgi:hypothetical protein